MSSREAFEAWVDSNFPFKKDRFDLFRGEYKSQFTEQLWQSWQASREGLDAKLKSAENNDVDARCRVAELEAKCAARDEKLRMINELIGAAEQANKLAQEATGRLIQERNALAAENAALKAFGGKLGDMHNDLNGEGTGIQGRADVAIQQVALEAAIEEFDAIKTPTTDAFLAEVRAQGVDSAVETIMVHMNHQHVAVAEALHILRTHAAQLRKGVQS